MIHLPNDEPSLDDSLGRLPYVQALSAVLERCETPLVVGLYGTWGSGKTSLMRQLQAEVEAIPGAATVWFDPWQHQFDEHPATALVQSAYEALGAAADTGKRKRMREIVVSFSIALAKVAVTQVPLVGADLAGLVEHGRDIAKSLRAQEQEDLFLRRDLQQRLDGAFRQFIDLAIDGEDGARWNRLFFFVDDLDRCTPDKVVQLLESFKLFMNSPRCVFVLGLDRGPVEAAIRHEYAWAGTNEADYLDKIIQLQFSLPGVAQESRERFVRDSLTRIFRGSPMEESPVVQEVVHILCVGIGGNPRQLKRVVGSFSLMHLLGRQLIRDYDPVLLAIALLVQFRSSPLFDALSRQPERFAEIFPSRGASTGGHATLYQEFIAKDYQLSRVVGVADHLADREIAPYLHLAEPPGELSREQFVPDILSNHQAWLASNKMKGEQGVFEGLDLTQFIFSSMDLLETNFKAANLEGASFRMSSLGGAVLDQAMLNGASFSGARLVRTGLGRIAAFEVDFSNATLEACEVNGSTFNSCDFSGAELLDMKLGTSKFEGCCFDSAALLNVDFTAVKSLDGSTVVGATLAGCQFYGALPDMSGVAEIENCHFVNCNFDNIDFSGAKLNHVEFFQCSFRRSVLRELDCVGSKFTSCSFEESTLDGANLSQVDLRECNFNRASLQRVDLSRAELVGATLVGANLSFAILWEADVRGAVFLDAILDDVDVGEVYSDDTTLWGSSRQPS